MNAHEPRSLVVARNYAAAALNLYLLALGLGLVQLFH